MIILQHRFLITVMPFEFKDKVKYTNNQFMACYANSFFIFILRTIIAYGESIIKKDSDHCYPGVKG